MKARRKKQGRGGGDRGQGRKKKYGEKTTTLSMRVPRSHKKRLTNLLRAELDVLTTESIEAAKRGGELMPGLPQANN